MTKDGSVASRKYRKDSHGGNKAAQMFTRVKKPKDIPEIIGLDELKSPDEVNDLWDYGDR